MTNLRNEISNFKLILKKIVTHQFLFLLSLQIQLCFQASFKFLDLNSEKFKFYKKTTKNLLIFKISKAL